MWRDMHIRLLSRMCCEMAFPALNELLVFSYGFTFEGKLIPPIKKGNLDDPACMGNVNKNHVVLTPFTQGCF